MKTLRLCLDLLSRRSMWHFRGILLLSTVRSMVETFAVVSIMPFISLVANPAAVEETGVLRWLYTRLGYEDVSRFLVLVGLLVLGVIVLSNVISALTSWALQRFVWTQHHLLSRGLLRSYLDDPYVSFLDRNTAELNKNILSQVRSVIWGVLLPGTKILARGITAVFLLALLLAVDWKLAILVFVVLGTAYGLIFTAVQRTQSRIGKEQVEYNRRRFQVAAEAFGGIKEIKVKGREDELLRRFSEPSAGFSRHRATNMVAGEMPRYAVESVAFGGIVLILIYLLSTGGGVAEILPLASLYAFAGYKLMPALQVIFHGATEIRFNRPALEEIHADLRSGERAPTPTAGEAAGEASPAASDGGAPIPESWKEVRVRDVTFRYPGESEPAVADVSMALPRGRVVGIGGATGAGKTTVLDILLGLLRPQEGSVEVDGVALTPGNLPEWKEHVGYVPQEIFLTDDTVEHNIAFALPDDAIDPDAVRRAARTAQIHEFVTGLSDGYDTVVGERGIRLSGGQRQRIGLARALYDDPTLLVLDEGTSALDAITEESVMDGILARGRTRTAVLVSHRLQTLRRCDRIHLLAEGRLVASGSWEDLLAGSPEFRAMAESARESEPGDGA